MSIFKKGVLTDAGKSLITKAQAGKTVIKFTKAESGAGIWNLSDELNAASELKECKQTFEFSGIDIPDGNPSTVILTVTINNRNLKELYYVTELGIYALDPDDGEVLYAIMATDSKMNYMPAENGIGTSVIVERINIEVSNSAATVIQSAGGLVSATEFVELKKLVNWIRSAVEGGNSGQILKKISSEDYETEWADLKKDVLTGKKETFPDSGDANTLYVDTDSSEIYVWKNGGYFKLPLGAEASQTLQKQITENAEKIAEIEKKEKELESKFEERVFLVSGTGWIEADEDGVKVYSQDITDAKITEETNGTAWPHIISESAADVIKEQKAHAVFFSGGRVFTEDGFIRVKCYKKMPEGDFGILIQGGAADGA